MMPKHDLFKNNMRTDTTKIRVILLLEKHLSQYYETMHFKPSFPSLDAENTMRIKESDMTIVISTKFTDR